MKQAGDARRLAMRDPRPARTGPADICPNITVIDAREWGVCAIVPFGHVHSPGTVHGGALRLGARRGHLLSLHVTCATAPTRYWRAVVDWFTSEPPALLGLTVAGPSCREPSSDGVLTFARPAA